MKIQEIKEMKRFPKNEVVVSASDKAMITISKTVYKLNKKGKKIFIYEGNVHFVYENGKQYRTDFREKSLKKTIEKTLECFDQRNKQMLNYEKRGLNFHVSN
jgi:DNA polymerase III alpha subunit (gram-positive type)